MRKITLMIALFAVCITYAQEETKQATTTTNDDLTVSLFLGGGGGAHAQFGVHLEKFVDNFGHFIVVNFAYGEFVYDENLNISAGLALNEVTLKGWVSEIGYKDYFSKRKPDRGFYYANYFSYGSFDYEEGDVYGKYSYFSFVDPEIGCKIMIGDFAIDPYVGVMWKIEMKGKGFVDNNNTSEWMPKFGLRLGWKF